MAVADNHKADLIRIFGQRAEVTLHSLSVLGRNLVGIGRTRSQIGQAGTIHMHALTLKLFALLYRNLERFLVRIARTVGYGGLHRFIQFPNDNHAVCFRGHQIRTRQERAGIRPPIAEAVLGTSVASITADSTPLSSRRIREDFLAIFFLLSLHGTAAAIPPRLC